MKSFDLDHLIIALEKTVFSPFLPFGLSLAILAHDNSTDSIAFRGSCVWLGILCLANWWTHIDRVYANQFSWVFEPSLLDWTEQIVLITGGGSGIGALLAEELSTRASTTVVLTKSEPEKRREHERIHTYICDVSKFEEVQRVAKQIKQDIGDPTIVVNNAGVVKGKLLLDLTEEDVSDTFGANTLAHFWILKAFLPAMLRRGKGHVVTLSSIMGLVGAAQMTDYCASKAALVNLHQSLRFELDARYKTRGVRTTLVLPSFTQTPLFSKTRLPTSRFFTFLAPPVPPQTVVDHIISAVERDESRVIRLPWYSNFARFMGDGVGIVPCWLRDLLQYLIILEQIAGADHAMREYGPHPDAAERLAVEREKPVPDTRE